MSFQSNSETADCQLPTANWIRRYYMSATSLPATQNPSRRRLSRLLTREYIAFYLFASPWLIGMLIFTVGPMIVSFYLSFTDYAVIVAPKWTGLDNYIHMATDDPLVW